MITLHSGCKINLYLNVLRRREDGFHELETVMQPVGLYDQLHIERRNQPGILVRCDHSGVPIGPENLICRAAQAFLQRLGCEDGFEIHLEKHLPVAAGVGGGSGNAAATLLGLNHLFEQRLSHGELDELAAGLGSDIPFFLESGTAVAVGRGERVQRLRENVLGQAWVVLVNPGFGISTPWAYQNLRLEAPGVHAPRSLSEFIDAVEGGDWNRWGQGLFNSLEQSVFPKYPVVEIIRKELLEAGADFAMMSGSGATVFGLVRSREQGDRVNEQFLKRYGDQCWSAVVPLVSDPVKLIDGD